MSFCCREMVDITLKMVQKNRIHAFMNLALLQLIMDIFP